jgi:hypothetical protein
MNFNIIEMFLLKNTLDLDSKNGLSNPFWSTLMCFHLIQLKMVQFWVCSIMDCKLQLNYNLDPIG